MAAAALAGDALRGSWLLGRRRYQLGFFQQIFSGLYLQRRERKCLDCRLHICRIMLKSADTQAGRVYGHLRWTHWRHVDAAGAWHEVPPRHQPHPRHGLRVCRDRHSRTTSRDCLSGYSTASRTDENFTAKKCNQRIHKIASESREVFTFTNCSKLRFEPSAFLD